MQEIVSPAQAEMIVRIAAIALIAAGAVGGALAAWLRTPRRAGVIAGACVAAAGGLVYILWMVYNAIITRLGLDSVKALLINLAIFVCVGLLYGLLAGAAWRWATAGPTVGKRL